jgi:hypothetical protein
MTDDQKRRAAMEKMFEEQQAKKELISKSLAAAQSEGHNHTKFQDEEDDGIKVDDTLNMDIDEPVQPVEAKKWMFDSDDDDDESDQELDIKINPVLEGEAGRKRLELQKKFKGDDRFKLGEDFIDEEEKNVKPEDLGDEITQGLGAEKDQAMDVLRAMFGDQKMDTRTKPKTNIWTNSARFDPEAENASTFLAQKPTEKESIEDNDRENQNEDNDGDDDDDDEDFFGNIV